MTKKIGIYQDPRKCKPWVCRWFGLPDLVTGKRKRYSRSFRLRAEAERFQAKQLIAFEDGKTRDRDDEKTLRELCNEFLKVKKRRESTIKDYQWSIDRLITYFGASRPLRQVTPQEADMFFVAQKSVIKDELSEWTRAKILRNCKAIFAKAVQWGWISKNPFADVEKPKLLLRDWHYITPAEYHRLLDAAPSLRWKAVYALAYTCGLRFGELFNLTWDNIDFENAEVIIRDRGRTATLPAFKVKTKNAKRKISLSRHTLDILIKLQHKVALQRVPFVLLSKKQFQNLLDRGKFLVNNVTREFNRHVRRAGIKVFEGETLTLHTLRKCAGKNWAEHLDPRKVQDLMGHASLQTTMKFYNQTSKEDKKKAADIVDALLGKTDARVTPDTKTA